MTAKDIAGIAKAAETDDLERIRKLAEDSIGWWRDHKFGVWAIFEKSGYRVLGWCGLRPVPAPSDPELLFGLAPSARGCGLATEAGRAVIGHAFTIETTNSVWAATVSANTRSVGVMERVGMSFESEEVLEGVRSLVFRIKFEVSS